jgi:hypothetical protein
MNGPGEQVPLTMVFDVARDAYVGFTSMGASGRAPHRNTVADGRVLRWEQSNSGGGVWVYSVRLITPDSAAGTLTLKGAGFDASHDFVIARGKAP